MAQIKQVYRACCKLNHDDEVWLYGFSRGAYVVRAVAGLLHYMRSLLSADQNDGTFDEHYKNALEVYLKMQSKDGLVHVGQVRTNHYQDNIVAVLTVFVLIRSTIRSLLILESPQPSSSWVFSIRSRLSTTLISSNSLSTIRSNIYDMHLPLTKTDKPCLRKTYTQTSPRRALLCYIEASFRLGS